MADFLTTWRKPESPIEWDFHISFCEHHAEQVKKNLLARGITDFKARELGPHRPDLSSGMGAQP